MKIVRSLLFLSLVWSWPEFILLAEEPLRPEEKVIKDTYQHSFGVRAQAEIDKISLGNNQKPFLKPPAGQKKVTEKSTDKTLATTKDKSQKMLKATYQEINVKNQPNAKINVQPVSKPVNINAGGKPIVVQANLQNKSLPPASMAVKDAPNPKTIISPQKEIVPISGDDTKPRTTQAPKGTDEFIPSGDTSKPPSFGGPGPILVKVVDNIHYAQDKLGRWVSNQKWSTQFDPVKISIKIRCPYFNLATLEGEPLRLFLQPFPGKTLQEKYNSMMAQDPNHIKKFVEEISKTKRFNDNGSPIQTAEFIATCSVLPKKYWDWASIQTSPKWQPFPARLKGLVKVKIANGKKIEYIKNAMGNKWIQYTDTAPTVIKYSPATGITLCDPDFNSLSGIVRIQNEALALLLKPYPGANEKEKFDNFNKKNPRFFERFLKELTYNSNLAIKQSTDPKESKRLLAIFERKVGDLLAILASLPDTLKTHINPYHDELYTD